MGEVTMKIIQCFQPNTHDHHILLVHYWYSPRLQPIYLATQNPPLPPSPQEIMYYIPLSTWCWVHIYYNSNSVVNICIKVAIEVNVYQVWYGALSVYDAEYKCDYKTVWILLEVTLSVQAIKIRKGRYTWTMFVYLLLVANVILPWQLCNLQENTNIRLLYAN